MFTSLWLMIAGSILISDAYAAPSNVQHFRACYLSLNNEKEKAELEKFVTRITERTSYRIEVREFLSDGGDPEAALRAGIEAMAARGEHCDGLVISGHHTGSFAGKRGKGVLRLDFVEKLACDPRYQDWFEHVNALWLQGCRTVVDPSDIRTQARRSYNADFHTQRVGLERERDNLPQGRVQFNQEFTQAMDPDNPISSRYRRVFPAATVFGWSWDGPGAMMKSEYSILRHIAHISRLSDDRQGYFRDPKGELPDQVAARYADILAGMLSNWGQRPACEDLAMDAWVAHGREKTTNLGFGIADVRALRSLESSGDSRLAQARADQCGLRATRDPKELVRILDRILSSEQSIGYNFNSLLELYKDLETKQDFEALDAVRKRLTGDRKLQDFLVKKIGSEQTGVLPKIEYYSFYKKLAGVPDKAIESMIRSVALPELERKSADRDVRSFQKTLMDSLSKHGILDHDSTLKVAETQEPDAPAERPLVEHVIVNRGGVLSTVEVKSTLEKVVPRGREQSVGEKLAAVFANGDARAQLSLFKDLEKSGKITSEVVNVTVDQLYSYGYKQMSPELFQLLVDSPHLQPVAFEDLVELRFLQITDIDGVLTKNQMEQMYYRDLEFYVDVANHRFATPAVLAKLAQNSDRPYSADLLRELLNSPKADSNVALAVSQQLRNLPPEPGEGAFESLARSVVHSKAITGNALRYVVESLTTRKLHPQRAVILLQSVHDLLASDSVRDVRDEDLNEIRDNVAAYLKKVPDSAFVGNIPADNAFERLKRVTFKFR